jgi:phosphatidylserine synthase
MAGILVGVFFRGVPLRGWIALILLFLSALTFVFSEPSDSSKDDRLWPLVSFMFFAPLAVIYSFRARKTAPDRMLARSAFVASFLIASFLLFMIFGTVFSVVLIISHYVRGGQSWQ